MRYATPNPAHVAAGVRELFEASAAQMNAYWVAVDGSRDEYGDALATELAGLPVVPLIIRAERFDNPNSIMSELAHILDRNQQRCLEVLGPWRRDDGRFALVLLARTELGITQSSSPVTLPDWIPHLGGLNIHCHIHDLSWRIEVPLNDDELGLPELHRRLFALESALVRRLTRVNAVAPDVQRELFAIIGRARDPGWTGVLSEANAALHAVVNAEGYRPGRRHGKAMVARLWDVTTLASAPDLLIRARALAAALNIDADGPLRPWRQGLLGLLRGAAAPGADPPVQFALNAMTTIAAACEYFNCAAHPEPYQNYPVALLRLLIDEMCRSLGDIESAISGLDAVWEPAGADVPGDQHDEEAMYADQ
jgi:hypothetical protein